RMLRISSDILPLYTHSDFSHICGPVGTYPARAVVTDWLRPAVEEGDPDVFAARVLASLDRLAAHDFQPDGITARYAVG
ncbi:MAG: hypothetical protein B7Z09_08575, partial [Brevundimonas diminuta]